MGVSFEAPSLTKLLGLLEEWTDFQSSPDSAIRAIKEPTLTSFELSPT